MRWIIIGTGNVAWHLAYALQGAGEELAGMLSREAGKAQELAQSLSPTLPFYSFETYISDGQEVDAYLLAVADDVIIDVSQKLTYFPTSIALHTSGTRSLSALSHLQEVGWKTGIFYPLQTLTKGKTVDWKQIPLLLESEDLPTLQKLEEVAHKISDKVVFSTSEKRLWLHLTAVMTANFMHHLCTIGNELLVEQNLSIDLLKPLLQETLTKAVLPDGKKHQTGPAKRNDQQTIAKHLALLERFPTWQPIYKAITDSILEMYQK
jgi:predicted short-subunit dehydrogenase-like oxidoreductase (DUF2520 family)